MSHLNESIQDSMEHEPLLKNQAKDGYEFVDSIQVDIKPGQGDGDTLRILSETFGFRKDSAHDSCEVLLEDARNELDKSTST